MKCEDHYRVPLEKLRKVCNYEDELKFCQTSQDASPLDAMAGQERAVKSMEFGLAMDADGYNIFVVGPPGTGKSEYAKAVVAQAAAIRQVPDDWCYVNNFSNIDKPLAVSLPAGKGREFQKDMEKLIAEIRNAIRKAFESTDYELKKDRIFNDFQMKMEEIMLIIGKKAFEDGFGVKPVAMKFIFIPLRDGRALLPEEYNELTDEQRREINEKRYELVKKLDTILMEGQMSEKKMTAQIFELARDTAFVTAEPLILELKEKYWETLKILEYLDRVLIDVVERNSIFSKPEPLSGSPQSFQYQNDDQIPEMDAGNAGAMNYIAGQEEAKPFTRYKVNLFITQLSQL